MYAITGHVSECVSSSTEFHTRLCAVRVCLCGTSTLGLLVYSTGLSHWMEQTSSEATTSSLKATTKFLRILISKFIYTFARNHRIRHLRIVVAALQQSHRTTCTSSARLLWLGSLNEMPSSPSKPSLLHQLIHHIPRLPARTNHGR
ncbi:hypothetical protein LCI18_000188 [Fusarium solani-melongenae]|uniref:Uncharacterized protein n=1 Tax=Fusarium solani subsp. cucurbitae TaxID=2747967 RepID=A0ACD3YN27_FUSSC|nr:hypothetical protein LCI18_000188 [Fusarium solani-melongenae]